MNTEKLTLEMLAHYVPYKLNFSTHSGKIIQAYFDFNGMNIIQKRGGMLGDRIFSVSESTFYRNYKPILKPMNDILNEVAIWIKETPIMRFEFDTIQYISWWLSQIANEYNEIPFIIATKIFQLHGDLFGLIEKGLAIDINTLEKISPAI